MVLFPDVGILAILITRIDSEDEQRPFDWPATHLLAALVGYGRTLRGLSAGLRVLTCLKPVVDTTRALTSWVSLRRIRPDAPPPIVRSRASRHLLPSSFRGSFYGSFRSSLGADRAEVQQLDLEGVLDDRMETFRAFAALVAVAVGVGAAILLADSPAPRARVMLGLLEEAAASGNLSGPGPLVPNKTLNMFVVEMAGNGENVLYIRLLGKVRAA